MTLIHGLQLLSSKKIRIGDTKYHVYCGVHVVHTKDVTNLLNSRLINHPCNPDFIHVVLKQLEFHPPYLLVHVFFMNLGIIYSFSFLSFLGTLSVGSMSLGDFHSMTICHQVKVITLVKGYNVHKIYQRRDEPWGGHVKMLVTIIEHMK